LGYGCLLFYCSTRLSVTGDEKNYFAYAVNIAKGNAAKEIINNVPRFNSQLPINVLNTIPRSIEQLLNPGLKRNAYDAQADIEHGRWLSILCAMLLAVYVLSWSTQLYGRTAGILSLLLYALCPNIFAHSAFVSTDVFSFLITTATCYHAWKYSKTGKMSALLLLAFYLGIGQISKQSLLLLYPVVFVLLITRIWLLKIELKKYILPFIKEWGVIILVSLVIINVGFLFCHTGKKINEYHFVSAKFNALQGQLSFANNIPIPLPEPYISGFDAVRFNVETGPGIDSISSFGSTYFLGEKLNGQLKWNYYLVSCLFKIPIPFLALLIMALTIYCKTRRERSFWQQELYLLLPAAFIFIMFSLFNPMYLGIKNVIMILPLLYVFCGSIISWILELKMRLYLLSILLLWQMVSVGRYLPDLIPYTNELIWNKTNAYKYLGDNNIYMQEGGKLVREYLSNHPEISFEPQDTVHGKVMFSIDTYYDWWNKKDRQWFRSLHLLPVDNFNSQYLIFNVP
jgi:hypothetical protein